MVLIKYVPFEQILSRRKEESKTGVKAKIQKWRTEIKFPNGNETRGSIRDQGPDDVLGTISKRVRPQRLVKKNSDFHH